jgi:hypothetical protein
MSSKTRIVVALATPVRAPAPQQDDLLWVASVNEPIGGCATPVQGGGL